jgi:alkylation response protein AidB-like acyl-CoA dehydrogenase
MSRSTEAPAPQESHVNPYLSEDLLEFGKAIRHWVDQKCPGERARALEAQADYPYDLWDDFSAADFHGVGIAEEFGGQGGTVMSQAVLGQGLARTLGGLVTVWGISSFAGGKSVGFYGTDEQKQRFLPRLAAGDARFSIAITEPDGGTDLLGNMRSQATKVGGGWVVNGRKTWSTGAHVADYLLVLASTSADERPARALTLFIVSTDSPGVSTASIPKLGIRSVASNEVVLEDVFVPDDLVLGEPGRGWPNIVATLNNERILTAAFCTGMLEGVLEGAVKYMNERQAFGGPIGRFQSLQHYVADIVTWKVQAELLTYQAAMLQDAGEPCGVESTMAKMVASEYVSKAADLGIQILGGMGYAAETDMQRFWRDSRVMRIAPVTTEMAKNMIAEAQGLPRSY